MPRRSPTGPTWPTGLCAASFTARASCRRVLPSKVQRALVDRQRRFLHGLRQRRMRMADARDVFARRPELHGDDTFGNQLRYQGTDGMHAEDAVGLGVGEKLDETARIAERSRAAIGHEG